MNFDVTGLAEEDYHSIKAFLTPLMDGENFLAGQLADLLISQNLIGSCIKVLPEANGTAEEEADVLGVVSMINLQEHEDVDAVCQLREYWLSKCNSADKKSTLERYLSDLSSPLGLLVSERVVNLPPNLVPPLLKCLFQEVDDAAKVRYVCSVYVRCGVYMYVCMCEREKECGVLYCM